jgi:putative isomerase
LDQPEFSHRLTPALFYPMLAGIPSLEQAKRMMKEHYYNTKEFYGDYIIPSCARNDKSFNNDYWRGAIWGPMNFLVYLGLRQYDRSAATDLADKSYKMYLDAWKKHHYVFENINSDRGVSTSSDNKLNSDPYYHWGALMGIMEFMERSK